MSYEKNNAATDNYDRTRECGDRDIGVRVYNVCGKSAKGEINTRARESRTRCRWETLPLIFTTCLVANVKTLYDTPPYRTLSLFLTLAHFRLDTRSRAAAAAVRELLLLSSSSSYVCVCVYELLLPSFRAFIILRCCVRAGTVYFARAVNYYYYFAFRVGDSRGCGNSRARARSKVSARKPTRARQKLITKRYAFGAAGGAARQNRRAQ